MLDTISLVFTLLFTAEATVKLLALDYHYFREAWNCFDFVIVVSSLMEEFTTIDFNPTMIRIFRVFRLARLLRCVLIRNSNSTYHPSSLVVLYELVS